MPESARETQKRQETPGSARKGQTAKQKNKKRNGEPGYAMASQGAATNIGKCTKHWVVHGTLQTNQSIIKARPGRQNPRNAMEKTVNV